MEYNFQKFEKTKARLEDRISITSFRSFGFPTKFFHDNKIDKYKYVILYYDEKNKAIGFQFTNNEQEQHKYTLIRSKQGYGGSVVATSFFKTYNLDPKKYKNRYEWKKKNVKEIGQLYVISLKEGEKSKQK